MCSDRPITRGGAAAAAALAFALALAAPAPAQEPAPLFVEFDVGDYPAAAAFFDASAITEIAEGLAAEAQKQGRLPYWSFRPAAGPADHPRLTVRVERQPQTRDLELVATLHLAAGDGGHGRWSGAFLPFAQQLEEGGLPARSTLPRRIVEAFARNLLTEARVTTNGGDMFVQLTELVPVGRHAHLVKDAAHGMVGLDRSRYGTLALSTFRLVCRKQDGAVVSLYSKGTGAGAEFPDPPFPAIVVAHDRWREGDNTSRISPSQLAALDDLRPSGVFLEHFDPTGLALGAGGGAPLPSVAPVQPSGGGAQ